MMGKGLASLALLLLLLLLPATALFGQGPTITVDRAVAYTTGPGFPVIATDTVLGLVYSAGHFRDVLRIGDREVPSRGEIDGYIACFDDQLRLRWIHTLQGPGFDAIRALDVIQGSGVLFAGYAGANTTTFTSYEIGGVTLGGKGEADAVVGRIGVNGTLEWVRNDGASGYDLPADIAHLPNGSIAVTGSVDRQSRFGDSTINTGKKAPGGYIQLLDASGNHVWVTHTVSDTNVFGEDGTASFGQISNITDTSFSVETGGVYASRIQDLQLYYEEQSTTALRCSFDGKVSNHAQWTHCRGPWYTVDGSIEFEGFSDNTSPFCVSSDRQLGFWYPSAEWERDTIMEQRRRDIAPSGFSAVYAYRQGSRATVLHAFLDTLDLLQTSRPADLIMDSGADRQPYLLFSPSPGVFQSAYKLPVQGWLECYGIAPFKNGSICALGGNGSISTNNGSVDVVDGSTVLLHVPNHTVSVQETEPNDRHPEPRSGEGSLFGIGPGEGPLTIHDLTGRLLGTVAAPIHSDALRARLLEYSGPLLLRQGTRVSLCHVYGPDHIAFALPAGSPR